MTTYYVGPGGNDGNAGTSWAARKLTLNGVEDIPVVAGDFVWVGPGVYRETLTVDVSGSVGNEIVYEADVTGAHTDGVGGVVRITGSDDDLTVTRSYGIYLYNYDYRIFRGFHLDSCGNYHATFWYTEYSAYEDCVFECVESDGIDADEGCLACTVKRCRFICGEAENAISWYASPSVDDTGHLVENTTFIGGLYGVYADGVGGVVVNNCTFQGCYWGAFADNMNAGQTLTVQHSHITGCYYGLQASNANFLPEDYNNIAANATDRNGVNTGAHSVSYQPLYDLPILHSGAPLYKPLLGTLSQWSGARALAGNGSEATDDFYGLARPTTSAKKSYGAIQYVPQARETSTVQAGAASLCLSDAGRVQFFVPVTGGAQVTISIYCYRVAGYAGTLPQMIIKEPGQADRTTTDLGGVGSWNQLSDTFTPQATSDYVVVELVSHNTAAAKAVYFDTLAVA